jgi:hypothetical protein
MMEERHEADLARELSHQEPPDCAEADPGTQPRPVALRGHSTRKSARTAASSTFNPLHVPDGLSNGKRGRQCAGLDPLEIDPAVLTAAGHPPRRTSAVVAAYDRIMGGEIFAVEFTRIKRHGNIRDYCLTCIENAAEVRRCTTFRCPFWPYRMGKNPHNPRRGTNPFSARRTD